MDEPHGEVGREDEISTERRELSDDGPSRGPQAFKHPILDVELERDLGRGSEAIHLVKGTAVLRCEPPPGDAEKASTVDRDPGEVDRVGVGLNEHGQVKRKLGKLGMNHLARPDQVKATKVVHDPAADIHIEDWAVWAVAAAPAPGAAHPMAGHHAEVASLSASSRRWAEVAVESAGARHSSPSYGLLHRRGGSCSPIIPAWLGSRISAARSVVSARTKSSV